MCFLFWSLIYKFDYYAKKHTHIKNKNYILRYLFVFVSRLKKNPLEAHFCENRQGFSTIATYFVPFRFVVEDLSVLRDRGPGFKTGSRLLTFTKAVTEFSEPYTLYGSHEFRHAKDVKTIELT
jgi:hypothetical protein